MDIGIYKNYSNTRLLSQLSTIISKLTIKSHKTLHMKVKFIIKEIKTRTLTQTQTQSYNRLVVRFSWI